MAKSVAVAQQQPAQQGQNAGLDQLKQGPARLGEFLHDVRSEMKKVITPTRDEVRSQTIVVIVTVFVFAAYFWAVDTVVGSGVSYVISHLSGQ